MKQAIAIVAQHNERSNVNTAISTKAIKQATAISAQHDEKSNVDTT